MAGQWRRSHLRSSRILVLAMALLLLNLCPIPSQAAFKYLHKGMTAPRMKGKDLLTGKKITCGQGDDHDSKVVVMAFLIIRGSQTCRVRDPRCGSQD